MTVPEIVIDSDRYPTEDSLTDFSLHPMTLAEADKWLVDSLPDLADKLMYPRCTVTEQVKWSDKKIKRVEFATGGWSGCEDLIETALLHHAIRARYAEWKRGGLHVFEVPT